MKNAPLRILLVSDRGNEPDQIGAELDRAGLDVELQRVEHLDSFADALREFSPSVVLCDHVATPVALNTLREVRPVAPLIVVTDIVDARLAVSCVREGAEDVVFKSQLDRLPDAIQSAIATRAQLEALSPRQLQVLQMVAEGHSTPSIARRLELSSKTVETYRSELMARLGIHDVVSLVRYAVRAGLVPQVQRPD